MRLWHVTRRDQVAEILREGLRPRIGPRSAALGEGAEAMYCFVNGAALEDALGGWLGEAFDGVALSVLEVEVPCEWVTVSRGFECEAVIAQAIPASAVHVLIEDADVWDGRYPGEPPVEWAHEASGEENVRGVLR